MSQLDDDVHLFATLAMIDATIQTICPLQIDSTPVTRVNHQSHRRSKRRKYDHRAVLQRIKTDFFTPSCVFNGKDFIAFFRISRARFQRLLEDIGASGIPFYSHNSNNRKATSLEAKILLPLKTLAYGVSYNTPRA